MGGRWPLLGSLHVRCLAKLLDQLGRRDDLFLKWASAAFENDDRRIIGELPEDNSSSVGRSMSSSIVASLPLPGREGGKGLGGSRNCLARLVSNWAPRRSFSSPNRFVYPHSSAIYLACSSCLTSNS